MALTSGDYEAQANRLRAEMGKTVAELRSNLTPSNCSFRSGVARRGHRALVAGRRGFRKHRHPGPTAIAGFGVALWLLAAARKRNKDGVHDVTLPLREFLPRWSIRPRACFESAPRPSSASLWAQRKLMSRKARQCFLMRLNKSWRR